MKFSSLQAAVLPTAKIEIQNEGGNTQYTLCMDFNALAKAKAELNKDFTNFESWRGLDPVDISTLCWCAFARFHKAVTLEQVREFLGAHNITLVYAMLMELCFPGIFDEKKEPVEGEPQPNPQDSKA